MNSGLFILDATYDNGHRRDEAPGHIPVNPEYFRETSKHHLDVSPEIIDTWVEKWKRWPKMESFVNG